MNTIFEDIYTENERDAMINFFDQLDQMIHNSHSDVKNHIMVNSPFHTREKILDYFGEDLESKNIDGLESKLRILKAALKDMGVIELTIAIEADQALREFIGKTLANLGVKKTLLKIHTDQILIGGAVVEAKGRINHFTICDYFKERAKDYDNRL